ncbi:hypothetical protein R3W88_011502 [Solanum pinnatisectum]|uniref:RNase H type-1 domain-containing protein n=1 Tax=Solanum pinnatisectum TaxID=50273 RepID=A0AAV9L6P8_9SOLN|nr:hypothetical protein R3W88_011502 [Solanum pinnatisectum]
MKSIPIGEVLARFETEEEIVCCCCDQMASESFEHHFVSCPAANQMWSSFARAAGVEFLQIKDTAYKWWNATCSAKLRPLFNAITGLLLWQIWKRRNRTRHGDKMNVQEMMIEVNRNLHRLAIFRYPWLRNIPEDWPNLVHFCEGYKPILVPKVIHWKPPMEGTYKCNSDGASKGNPRQSAGGFCIRDWKGEFIFVATYDLGIRTGLEAETSAMEKGLNYCVTHNLLPVCLETDSLVLTKILNGVWEVPWSIKIQIQKIEFLRNNREVAVLHTLREGNKVADYFTNFILSFAGTENKTFQSIQDVPKEGKSY